MTTLTLVHNPTSGIQPLSPRLLLPVLARHGFRVRYISSKMVRDLSAELRHFGPLMAVAGGDGTVADVIHAVADRPTTIGIVPSGVANNIAASLGIKGPPPRAVAGWRRSSALPVQRAKVRIKQNGERWMLESIGIGAFAEAARTTPHRDSSSFARIGKLGEARRHMAATLRAAQPIAGLKLNGEDLSGRVLFLEVLNIPLTGPNICLARGLTIGDGRMRAVYAGEAHREALVDWLDSGADPALMPALPAIEASAFKLRWAGATARVDDDFLAGGSGKLKVACEPIRARILAPP